jgi:hypothetical protein
MKKKDVEYSKRQISSIVKLWFAGAIFGMCYLVVQLIIAPDMASLDGLLTYIGAPMSCGVVTYLIKSAMENREKIKQDYRSDYGEEEITYENEKGE